VRRFGVRRGTTAFMARFLLGVTTGAVAGYLAVRSVEAVRELRCPSPVLAKDPARYGARRRALMLAGIGRSLATLATLAYAIGPRLEPAAGTHEPWFRRAGTVAGALLLGGIVELPTDFVEGFALERRYGLSEQTPAAWGVDRLKETGLGLAFGVPLVEALAALIRRFPSRWPVALAAATVPLSVGAAVVVPVYLAPLFNTFAPIEGPIRDRIVAIATRFRVGDATLLTMDMGRRTVKANAYVTGLFGTQRIVVGDTLLDNFAADETMFVVAHELGHYVARDVWRGVALTTAVSALTFAAARRVAERPGHDPASAAALARLAFAASLIGTALGPVAAAFSRSRERAADRFAIAATNDAAAGVAAFERLRERNMAEDEQPRWMELLFSSHPSLGGRIARLREAAAAT